MRYDLPESAWHKSSYSSSGQPDCVEHQVTPEGTHAVRDSKRPELGAYEFSPTAWTAFVEAVKSARLP
ncbi:DUF397 domain-containing protein [Streptomyces bluensis]|uniref:DUF397 domain-containing protein n=1 Tax=Streptomyces bluensis TaxID=33897 RepID=UPI00332043D5